jgi:DNA repair exonuclease SbcCD ATPase subunit
MKLIDLEVRSFGRVRNAKIEFGPGLNVFHGPNDLGKSTLVRAIRAVLLLPFRSKEAERFIPWSGGGTPYVNLCFQTSEGVQYRVSKKFGARAELQERPRGASWRRCARGREVDDKLREVLRWGLEGPGRGIPASFLSTVLLADQGEVEAVLRSADLQSDRSESGRQWLTDVLEASAMDPFFLKTLERVERHYSEAFTGTGRRARTQDSPLKRISDRVNAARKELAGVQEKIAKLDDVRRTLTEKRAQAEALGEELQQARDRVTSLAARSTEAAARQALETSVAEASAAFKAALFRQDDVAEAEIEAQRASADADMADSWVQTATQLMARQTQAVASAQAAADRGPGAQEDTILRLQVERDLAGLADELSNLERDLAAAQEYGRLVAEADAAQEQLDKLAAQGLAASESLVTQVKAEAAAAREQARSKQRLAGIELRGLDLKIEALAETCQTLRDAHSDADRLQAQAQDELEGLGATLPDRATLAALQTLHSDLREARAAVELGLAVVLRPDGAIGVEVATDGAPAEASSVSRETSWGALRELRVTLEGVGDLHIQAGSEAKRARAAELADQWAREGAPVLARAGVGDLAALRAGVEAQTQARHDAEERLTQSQLLRPSVGDLEAATSALEAAQATRPALSSALSKNDSKALDHAPHGDTALLGEAARQGGEAPRELQALASEEDIAAARRELEGRIETIERELRELRSGIADLRVEQGAAQASLGASAARVAQLREAQEQRPAAMRQNWEKILASGEKGRGDLASRRDAVQQRLTRVESTGDRPATDLDAVLEDALALETAMRGRLECLAQLQAELRDSRTRSDANLQHLRADPGADLGAARSVLKAAQQALDGAPRAAPVAQEDREEAEWDLADIAEEFETLGRDLHAYDLQLRGAEGQSVADEKRDLEERCEQLEAQERELEAQYAGWDTLREVMIEVQEDLTSNLGSALVPQVQRRFNELATDPYTLAITSSLKTEGVVVAGQARDPNALSVGTRDQLATVYRLALAEQLGSMVVLDDQLVHSDAGRMRTLLSLLTRAARHIQVVVFTCRPDDYESAEPAVRTLDLGPLVESGVVLDEALTDGAASLETGPE